MATPPFQMTKAETPPYLPILKLSNPPFNLGGGRNYVSVRGIRDKIGKDMSKTFPGKAPCVSQFAEGSDSPFIFYPLPYWVLKKNDNAVACSGIFMTTIIKSINK